MQRLHVGDLAGHLLERAGGSISISRPSPRSSSASRSVLGVTTRGRSATCFIRRGIQAILDAMKVEMGSATFSAQYQQSPVPPGGNMIDWKWFSWFDPDGS